MHIDRLLERLGSGTVLDESGRVLVHCPAHGDGRPSLFVSLKPDGRALVHCRAGCATKKVLEAAGITLSDLFEVDGELTLSNAPVVELSPGAVAALNTYLTAASNDVAESPAARYAAERFGISADVARQLRLGYDDGTVSLLLLRRDRPDSDTAGTARITRSSDFVPTGTVL